MSKFLSQTISLFITICFNLKNHVSVLKKMASKYEVYIFRYLVYSKTNLFIRKYPVFKKIYLLGAE
jgi:hypothetical protein